MENADLADEKFIPLRRELEAAEDAKDAFYASGADADDPSFEQHWTAREKIDATPATGLPGLFAKARAAELALKNDVDAESDGPGSFISLARSIIRDLKAIEGNPTWRALKTGQERQARLAESFADLEADIGDLCCAVMLLETVKHATFRDSAYAHETMKIFAVSSKVFVLNDDENDALEYAFVHVGDLVRRLKEKHRATIGGPESDVPAAPAANTKEIR